MINPTNIPAVAHHQYQTNIAATKKRVDSPAKIDNTVS
jgi:hypothetical protein